MDKPNILVIISDQQRYDTLDVAGINQNITPHLDAIGKEGALFQNCFSVQPLCGPARSCLQSGRYATETGNYKNGRALPKDCDSVAKYLKAAGYETAYIGKWHIYKDVSHLKKLFGFYDVPVAYRGGYSFWEVSNALEFTSHAYDGYLYDNHNHKIKIKGYRADFVTNLAIHYLENRRDNKKPFALFLSYIEPHQQNDLRCFTGPIGSKEKYAHFSLPKDLEVLKGDAKESMPDYLGMCANLDENVGRVEECLKKRKEWDETVFLYSADHGCHFKTRNAEYKRSCHDASCHVPLVAHGPGFNGRGKLTGLVTLLDIPCTMLYAAKVPQPKGYRGLPLQLASSLQRPDVFIQTSEDCIGRALRTEKWKYGVTYNEGLCGFEKPSSPVYYETYLYNLSQDPSELNNLVADSSYCEVRAKLREALLAKIKEIEHETPEIKPIDANPNAGKHYSFSMSLREMEDDPKSRAVIQRVMPILLTNKQVALGENLKFFFIAKYASHVPFVRGKIKKLAKELDALNKPIK